MMLKKIIRKIKLKLMSDEEYARYIGVKIGKNCRITTRGFSSEPYLIKIGNNVRVANDVFFFTHGGLIPFRTESSDLDIFGKIEIGNNVHIGQGAYIMPGVTIGDNCIIGAGSVIGSSVPSGFVAAGNPAKLITKTIDFIDRAKQNDFMTKKMTKEEKRKYLLDNIEDPRFVVKKLMVKK